MTVLTATPRGFGVRTVNAGFSWRTSRSGTLLSTYTLSESYVNGISTVSETINNTTTLYSKPSSPFVVNTGSGSNTVNIRNTSAGIAITEIGGNNTVNVGEGSGNFGLVVLWAAVNIQNPASPYTLNVNDSADMTARTLTLSTYSSGGANWGSITGLGAAINYEYSANSSVNITTGHALGTVNVQGTGVTTNITTGYAVVNVGEGNVQGILGTLNIQSPYPSETINVDDSVDTTARTVTLSTSSNWESITGLAPAAISYNMYSDTASVNITTGQGADTFYVLATSVTTNIYSGGSDTFNVSNDDSVQGILGTLNIQNSEIFNTISNTIYIDDFLDPAGRNVTLSTYSSGGATGAR